MTDTFAPPTIPPPPPVAKRKRRGLIIVVCLLALLAAGATAFAVITKVNSAAADTQTTACFTGCAAPAPATTVPAPAVPTHEEQLFQTVWAQYGPQVCADGRDLLAEGYTVNEIVDTVFEVLTDGDDDLSPGLTRLLLDAVRDCLT